MIAYQRKCAQRVSAQPWPSCVSCDTDVTPMAGRLLAGRLPAVRMNFSGS